MRTFLSLFLAFSAALALQAAPVPKGPPPEMELRPLATDLFVGEAFEAFVRFTNRGENEVFLFRDSHLVQRVGNVTLEVKGPRDKEFRTPYTVTYPVFSNDGIRDPLKKGVKAGDTRCEFVTLPWFDAGTEKLFGEFEEAGEWQVRAKVVLHSKEEKVSSAVRLKVTKRTDAEAKRHADKVAELDRPSDKKMTSFGDEFKSRLKLVDDLGACYTADQWRRRYLGFRLAVVGSERSKETDDEVMKDIDAYLKAAPQPNRDRLCWALAEVAYSRQPQSLKDLAVARKYLAQIDYLPDNKQCLSGLFDAAEGYLKAKPPEKTDDKK